MILYHVTDKRNLASILEHGLLAYPDYILDDDDSDGVNFVTDLDEFYRIITKSDIVLQVDSSVLDPEKTVQMGSWWIRFLGCVPPELISIK